MPRSKTEKSRDDRLEKKKAAEKIRMQNIRKDPEKYALWKEKQKQSYLKKKIKGKIVPICDLNSSQKKLARQKSRESSRKHFLKKKMERIMQLEEEEVIYQDSDDNNSENIDPLNTQEPSITLDSVLEVKKASCSNIVTRSTVKNNQKRPLINLNIENDAGIDSDTENRLIDFESQFLSATAVPLQGENTCSSKKTSASTVKSTQMTPLMKLNITNHVSVGDTDESIDFEPQSSSATPVPQSPQSGSSCYSPLPLNNYQLSPTTSKSKAMLKKKSPWKYLLRQLRYRTKQNQKMQEKKIQELKLQNDCYRKQIKRLQKQKKIETIVRKLEDNRQRLEKNDTNQLLVQSSKNLLSRDIDIFFGDDENSRVCPGKKEYITRHKDKKQKRYLNDSVSNLHKKFLQEHPEYKVSYSFFTTLRPFWAVIPNANIRDTCMCKDHQNMELAVISLKQNNLITEKSTDEILKYICCDPKYDDCLNRKCKTCKDKYIIYKEFDNSNDTHYWFWTKNKKSYVKDGTQKFTVQTVKQKVSAHPKEIIDHYEKLIDPYMSHISNVIAQSKYIKHLKANLKPEECLVHCDFSENYNTKYATEIQQFHFGSSRQQICMHTAVISTIIKL